LPGSPSPARSCVILFCLVKFVDVRRPRRKSRPEENFKNLRACVGVRQSPWSCLGEWCRCVGKKGRASEAFVLGLCVKTWTRCRRRCKDEAEREKLNAEGMEETRRGDRLRLIFALEPGSTEEQL
jgi:hypothetical protein